MAEDYVDLAVRFQADLASLDQAFGAAKVRISEFSRGVGNLAAGARTLGADLSTYLTAPLALIGGSAIRSAANIEQLQVAFGTFLGDAEKGRQVLQDLREFAAATPFRFDDIAEAGRSLLAFGVSAETLQDELRAIGDVSAGVGVRVSDLAEIYGKAKTQGRLFAEDVNQLTGRGIPIIAELAKQFGVAESEVKLLVEKGQVGFPQLQKAFQDLTAEGGRFHKMMEAQSQTLGGLFSTALDTVQMALEDIGLTMVEAFDLKEVLADVITGIGNVTAKIQAFIKENPNLSKFAITFAAVAAAIGPVILAISGILTLVNPLALAFIAVGAAVAAAVTYFDEIRAALRTNSATVSALQATWLNVKAALVSTWQTLRAIAYSVFNDLRAFWDSWGGTILAIMGRMWDQAVNLVTTGINLIAGVVRTVTALLRGDWSAAWEGLGVLLDTAWNFIKRTVLHGVDAVLAALQKLLGWIPGMEERLGKAREAISAIIDEQKAQAGVAEFQGQMRKVEEAQAGAAKAGTKAGDEITGAFTGAGEKAKASMDDMRKHAETEFPKVGAAMRRHIRDEAERINREIENDPQLRLIALDEAIQERVWSFEYLRRRAQEELRKIPPEGEKAAEELRDALSVEGGGKLGQINNALRSVFGEEGAVRVIDVFKSKVGEKFDAIGAKITGVLGLSNDSILGAVLNAMVGEGLNKVGQWATGFISKIAGEGGIMAALGGQGGLLATLGTLTGVLAASEAAARLLGFSFVEAVGKMTKALKDFNGSDAKKAFDEFLNHGGQQGGRQPRPGDDGTFGGGSGSGGFNSGGSFNNFAAEVARRLREQMGRDATLNEAVQAILGGLGRSVFESMFGAQWQGMQTLGAWFGVESTDELRDMLTGRFPASASRAPAWIGAMAEAMRRGRGMAAGGLVLPNLGGVPALLSERGEAEAVLPISAVPDVFARTLRTAFPPSAMHGAGGGSQVINVWLDGEVLTSTLVRGMPAFLDLHGVRR